MENKTEEAFSGWAIVEVMGHRRYAGYVRPVTVGSACFVGVQIPETDRGPAFNKLLGAASIYCITPASEDTARAFAEKTAGIVFDEFDLQQIAEHRARSAVAKRARLTDTGVVCQICYDNPCTCDTDPGGWNPHDECE